MLWCEGVRQEGDQSLARLTWVDNVRTWEYSSHGVTSERH
jgi:hypothetical protein